jgi:hypothetical protein
MKSTRSGRLRRLEVRPAPIFLVTPGPMLAAVGEQPLADVLPHGMRPVETHRVQAPDLDGAEAPQALDAEEVARISSRRRDESGTGGLPAARGSESTASHHPSPAAGGEGSLSAWLISRGFGMRQLTGRCEAMSA